MSPKDLVHPAAYAGGNFQHPPPYDFGLFRAQGVITNAPLRTPALPGHLSPSSRAPFLPHPGLDPGSLFCCLVTAAVRRYLGASVLTPDLTG